MVTANNVTVYKCYTYPFINLLSISQKADLYLKIKNLYIKTSIYIVDEFKVILLPAIVNIKTDWPVYYF
jgi:hypothetical protein